MRKRVVSVALAVVLAMGLGIPAFADADGEEDLFAASMDLARYLEQAPGVVSVSYTELCGTIDGGEKTDVDVEWDYAESAYNDYQDGYRLTMAEYEAYDPVENYQAAAVVADEGEVYFVTASDIDEEDLSLARYESVPEDGFSDLSQLSAYFAALGGRETDAGFTAELDILGTEDDGDDYDEYRVTAQDIKEEAETEGLRIEDREGESPLCGTAEDFLRTVYRSTRSTR